MRFHHAAVGRRCHSSCAEPLQCIGRSPSVALHLEESPHPACRYGFHSTSRSLHGLVDESWMGPNQGVLERKGTFTGPRRWMPIAQGSPQTPPRPQWGSSAYAGGDGDLYAPVLLSMAHHGSSDRSRCRGGAERWVRGHVTESNRFEKGSEGKKLLRTSRPLLENLAHRRRGTCPWTGYGQGVGLLIVPLRGFSTLRLG